MIVCPEAGFFFIHIPKNGGSSVRDQIQPFDHFEGQFRGTKKHPEIGLYDSAHVPLAVLRDHFTEAFSMISTLEGYGIVRNPVDRFASSMAQRFRQIHNRRPDTVSNEDVKTELDAVFDELSQTDRPVHHEFSFFIRQTEFIDLDGTRMVSNLYRLSDTKLLIRALGERLQKPLVEDFHSNKTVTFRHDWAARPAIAMKDFVKAYAPTRVADGLRRVAMKALTTPKVQAINEHVRGSKEAQEFITTYYREDFDLFESIASRQSQSGQKGHNTLT